MSESEVEMLESEGTPAPGIHGLDTISKKILIKTVRTFLSACNTNTPVNKNLLQKNAWGETSMSKVKLRTILEIADGILRDVYGYRIQVLDPKETINAKGTRKESTQEQWTLFNGLDVPYNAFVEESVWLALSKKQFYSELSQQRNDYRNNKEQFPTLKSEYELVLSGIALTVISLIIVHSNKMDETELLTILKKNFGMDPNKPLEVLGFPPLELLKTLDKMDYVNRLVLATDNGGEPVVEYNVGRRAKVEFNRDNFIGFLRVLYDIQDDETDPEFAHRMAEALEPVYGKI